ncbi:MAG TPA: VCBS repeat-containing protein [Candidatus Dormibacteraeota bacterium]
MRRRQQSGQALVAALITMLLLFALAGGLAMAASAALSQQRGSEPPSQRDFDSQSLVQAVAAATTSTSQSCPSGGLGQGGELSGYGCSRLPLISPLARGSAALSWTGSCAVGALNATGRITAWVNTLGSGYRLSVDGDSSACGSGGGCSSGASSGLVFVQDCDVSGLGGGFVHLAGSQGPIAVRYAAAASFVPGPMSPMPAAGQITSITAGHFHAARDGIDDLAVAIAVSILGGRGNEGVGAQEIDVFRGLGDGSFRECASIPADNPSSVTAADFNGDGIDDLAFTNPDQDDNSVTVLLATGDCAFTMPNSANTHGVGQNPSALVAARLRSGSGPPDLAVANRLDGTVSVLLNHGDGTFATAAAYDVGGPSAIPVAITAGRFLTSAAPDLAVADSGLSSAAVLPNQGAGTFGPPTQVDVGAPPTSVVAGTFNGSSMSGIAVGTAASWIAVLAAGSGGAFTSTRTSVGGPVLALATGNLVAHGLTDVAALIGGSNAVLPLLSNGDGTFRQAVGGALPAATGALTVGIGKFAGSASYEDIVSGGDAAMNIEVHNRQALITILAPDASGGGTKSEADMIVGGPGGARLTYEGEL